MTIQPDSWIRKMAHEHGMIEPFVEKQVSTHVISYGVSSYGYDIRIADEYKIFTDVFSAIVDPKHFDPKSMVDFKGDVCIIPPNSFVLARTIEYFRIPRNVLTLCVGKSTYARCGLIVNVTPFEPCFSADTEILTPAGWALLKDIRIGDCVMGMGRDGFAEYQPVIAKQERNYQGDLLHFAGRSIDLLVTPDHKLFVKRRTNGRTTRKSPEKTGWHTTEASHVFGAHNFEMSRQISWRGDDPGETLTVNGVRYPTRPFLRFLGLWLGDGSAYIPQKNGKNSGYIVQIAAFDQKRTYVKEVLDELGIHYNEMREGFRFYSKPLHDYLQPYKLAPHKHVPREWLNLKPELLRLILEGLLMADGNKSTNIITTVSPQLADDIQVMAFLSGQSAIVRRATPDKRTRTLNGQVIRGNYDVYKIRLTSGQLTPKIGPDCHRIVPYNGKVYDVTVPNHLIFVRRNGKAVWSGNCWEGFVTLEISNTTPLPAKVYSNEGIAQVLFFVADQECETSYKDRKGKYDKQTGVVPAKVIK
jgi:deoxycytidine triphosphate deaminase